MARKRYRTFSHTADLGLEIYGGDLDEIFTNSAVALFAVLTNLSRIREKQSRDIRAEGNGLEDLLVNYLSEFLYQFDTDQMLFHRILVLKLDSVSVAARGWGEPFDPSRHQVKTGIKAVTRHQVSVLSTPAGYRARLILDV